MSAAHVLTLGFAHLDEKPHHVFVCNDLALKSSTHPITEEDVKSWESQQCL